MVMNPNYLNNLKIIMVWFLKITNNTLPGYSCNTEKMTLCMKVVVQYGHIMVFDRIYFRVFDRLYEYFKYEVELFKKI